MSEININININGEDYDTDEIIKKRRKTKTGQETILELPENDYRSEKDKNILDMFLY